MTVTLGEQMEHLAPGIFDDPEPLGWPPDGFALAAAVLRSSDAYTRAIDSWPPEAATGWTRSIRRLGVGWRRASVSELKIPGRLRSSWRTVVENRELPLERVRSTRPLWEALLTLVAAADEACSGAGFLPPTTDAFHRNAHALLLRRSSLSERIDPRKLLVLPKVRAPRSGITMRSLTHSLALTSAGEVSVGWNDWSSPANPGHTLNLLLLPWPESVWPRQFRAEVSRRHNLPPGFGFFRCDVRSQNPIPVSRVRDVVARARRKTGDIDGIVLPELALLPGEAEKLCRATGAFIIAGEGNPKAARGHNAATVAAPFTEGGRRLVVRWSQPKHHRWRLDKDQIEMYGLVDQLEAEREWWERFPIEPRRLEFWRPREGITACVLICEDLARPDPGAELIRAVAPNLVIALLLDGPQLLTRWPARYATVLADDPGSSVLTLTSLGMAALSRPSDQPISRVIGLWKDPVSGRARELLLPEGHDALVLKLKPRDVVTWTADGRPPQQRSAFLTWSACVPVPMGR